MSNFVKKHQDGLFFCLLLLFGLLGVTKAKELPGLYLDAMYPDYLAVQLLMPQQYSTNMTIGQVGIPLLGQLYHGTITMFATLLWISLTGNVSVYSVHIINMLYGIISCFLLYKILLLGKVHNWLAMGIIFSLCLSPNLNAIYRTQYFIELPGVMFTLLGFYFLLMWIKQGMNSRKLVISGIVAGLAFYSYFNYLFFLPAYYVAILYYQYYMKNDTREKISTIAIWSSGFCCGGILYLIGYINVFFGTIQWLSHSVIIGILIGITIVLYGIVIYAYKFYSANNRSYRELIRFTVLIIIGIGCLTSVFAYWVFPEIKTYLVSLKISGEAMSIDKRMILILKYISEILNNSVTETLITGMNTSIYKNAVIIFSGLVCMATVLNLLYHGRDFIQAKGRLFMGILMSVIIYCICSIPLASRMQPQHFVIIIFTMYALLAIGADNLFFTFYNGHYKSIKVLFEVCIVMLILFNLHNQNNFIFKMEQTGGVGKFTVNINELAYNAINNKNEGGKELYIFPEWGLLCGFNYLTKNQIAFCGYIDQNIIKIAKEDGYSTKICYWDENKTIDYKNKLNGVYPNISEECMINRTGKKDILILLGTND